MLNQYTDNRNLNISTKNFFENILFSPGNMYVICSVSLNTCSLHPRSSTLTFVLEQSSDRDHNTIVYAESFIRCIKSRIPFLTHDTHHFLQSFITSHTTHNQYLFRFYMRHCTFYNINQYKQTREKQEKNSSTYNYL